MMTPFKEVLVLLLVALPFSKSSSHYDGTAKLSSAVESKCEDLWPQKCKKERKHHLEVFSKNCGKKGSRTGFCCETCNDLHDQGLIIDSKADEMSPVGKNIEEQPETCRKESLFNHQGAFSVSPEVPKKLPRRHSINLKAFDMRTQGRRMVPRPGWDDGQKHQILLPPPKF